MYEIKVTVDVPGLPEAISALASALSNVLFSTPINSARQMPDKISDATNKSEEKAQPKENPTQAQAVLEAAQTAPQFTQTPPAQLSQTVPTAAPSEAKSYTVDDLSRAGATLIDQGKMPQLLDLLKKYGVQAVTQLDKSVYPACVEEMKALGAKL